VAPVAATVSVASGLTLSYAEQGDRSGPVVVFLPGPTDSWLSYGPVLEHLPLSSRSIAVSQRGHGDSDKPAAGYRVEDFAADAVSLLDCLGVERAVLAGHSGSCLVARRVAIDHPARVAGLVLEASSTTLRGDAGFETFFLESISTLQDPIDTAFVRSFVVQTTSDSLARGLLEQVVHEIEKVPARVWREMFAELLVHDDLTELTTISAPTLLVWGDADGVIDRAMQENLEEHISDAQLVVYDGAGHTPRLEEPTRFAGDVASFVERTWDSCG
jgi:pimeloyl-ACP methyl ester carboxylesterase